MEQVDLYGKKKMNNRMTARYESYSHPSHTCEGMTVENIETKNIKLCNEWNKTK